MLPNIHRDDDGKRRRRHGSGVVVAVRTGRRDGGCICSKLSELLGHEMSKAKMLQSLDLYYCNAATCKDVFVAKLEANHS